jgi:hydroxymethylbilane synthase
MLPAVGQGALGLEVRADDESTKGAVFPLDDPSTRAAITAERAMLAALRGGCLAPVGAWGHCDENRLRLEAVVLSPDGKERLAVSGDSPPEDADQLGRHVADDLLRQGAAELIAGARKLPPE